MKRILLTACAVAAQIACSNAASADWFRPLDRGGAMSDYVSRIASSVGQRHEIRGDCMSACTMWLGHSNACVAPDAVLYFHGASDALRAMRSSNPWKSISAEGNAALMAFYPARVRSVVRPWLQSPEFKTLTGAQLIQLGVRSCDTAPTITVRHAPRRSAYQFVAAQPVAQPVADAPSVFIGAI